MLLIAKEDLNQTATSRFGSKLRCRRPELRATCRRGFCTVPRGSAAPTARHPARGVGPLALDARAQSPEPKIRNPKSEIRNPKSEIRNPKSRIQDSRRGTRWRFSVACPMSPAARVAWSNMLNCSLKAAPGVSAALKLAVASSATAWPTPDRCAPDDSADGTKNLHRSCCLCVATALSDGCGQLRAAAAGLHRFLCRRYRRARCGSSTRGGRGGCTARQALPTRPA